MPSFVRQLSILTILVSASFTLSAQMIDCGQHQLYQQNPDLRHLHEVWEQRVYEQISSGHVPQNAARGAAAPTIAVVVHIIHQNGPENISDAQVQRAINQLNASFANTGYYDGGNGVMVPIQFCLAKQAPDGNASTGITRTVSPLTNMTMETQDLSVKNLSRWNPMHYLNVWLVRSVSSQSSGSGVVGYAYFPSSHGTAIDGVLMEADFFGTNEARNCVLTHEVGHYLGLYHTFQGGCKNDDCAKDGDHVCDTPPDQSTAWKPCGTPENTCDTDTKSGLAKDENDMTINYMDYATIDCYNAFTDGQRERMVVALTETRASLLDSKGCFDPCDKPISAAFSASSGPNITVGGTVNFNCINPVANTYSWKVNGVAVGNLPNMSFTFNTLGQHIVELSVTGNDSNCFDVWRDTFEVICGIAVDFSYSPESPEINQAVTLNSSTAAGLILDWRLNGNPIGSTASITTSFKEADTYYVCLTASNAFCDETRCKSIEITDTINCIESYRKHIDYVPGSGNNIFLAGAGIKKLPKGELLGYGWLTNGGQKFLRFSEKGNLLKHWQMDMPNAYILVSDVDISSDDHVLFLRSPISTYGNLLHTSYLGKMDYTSGNNVWLKNFEAKSTMIFPWNIVENPITKNYQVFARTNKGTGYSTEDEAVVLDIDPSSGDVIGQKNYRIQEVPMVINSEWVSDALYGVGQCYDGGPTAPTTAFLAKFDPFAKVLWSREYMFNAPVFDPKPRVWSQVKHDKGSLVLVGTNGTHVFFLKTDLEGQPIQSRIYWGGFILHFSSHANQANIEVLPDGYLISFAQENGAGTRLVLLKTDKNGDVVWKKSVSNSIGLDGTMTLLKNEHIYALSGQNFKGDELILLKTPLLPPDGRDCVNDAAFTLNMVVPTVSSKQYFPQPLVSEPVTAVSVSSSQKPQPQNFITYCANVLCAEICNNNRDDDNDGLVDCADEADCPCTDSLPKCSEAVLGPTPTLIGKVEWQSVNSKIASCVANPYVANLDPQRDKIPEIIVNTYGFNADPNELVIFAGDGSDAGNPSRFTVVGDYSNNASLAIGDIDNNGIPEIVMPCLDKKLRIYTGYDPKKNPAMSLMMTIDVPNVLGAFAPKVVLADLNADGQTEIICGNQIFILDFSNPLAPKYINLLPQGGIAQPDGKRSTFAADLLSVADCGNNPDCEGLEIIAGNTIYSIDLDDTPVDGDPRSMIIRRTAPTVPNGIQVLDGCPAVADVDLDGTADVVTRGTQQANGPLCLYIWNAQKFIRLINYPNLGLIDQGVPTIANVFDDTKMGATKDLPEILFSGKDQVYAFNLNAAQMNPAKPFWWTVKVNDPFNFHNPPTTFDFNGDNWPEIAIRDEDSLRVIYGGNAPYPKEVRSDRTIFAIPMRSFTLDEYPVIADVDNDGQAEIVCVDMTVTAGNSLGQGRLKVVGADVSKGPPWMPARRVWNQYNYSPYVINDDLSIPKVPQQGHLEIPTGSGKRPLNITLGQRPIKVKPVSYKYLPDASLQLISATCLGDKMQLRLKVCNAGSEILPFGTPIRFYRGDPLLSSAFRLTDKTELPKDLKPDSCLVFNVLIDKILESKIFAVINDNGSKPAPFKLATDFPMTTIKECEYANNFTNIDLPKLQSKPNLGPDINTCKDAAITLQVKPSGYLNYRWSDLSTDTVTTVFGPGIYWVEVKDVCGLTMRDTIVIKTDPATQIELGPDLSICGDTSLQLSAPTGFTAYFWYPADGLSCTNCASPTLKPTKNITYSLQAKTALGCFSSDTLQIRIQVAPQTAENQSVCSGDSVLIFGKYQHTAGTYAQKFKAMNGCDSTHSVSLAVMPTLQTTENQSVCSGDSVLIFGKYQHTAGTYAQKFKAMNGCDSTHSVSLAVMPTPQTTEKQSVCSGDSVLIFGKYQRTAGIYAQKFKAINGCDSTHSVSLAVLPTLQTTENQSVCSGDSVLIFGKYQRTAGIYAQKFKAMNGCDSTHSISLAVLPTLQTTENQSVCSGDSVLIFGKYQHTAGTYAQKFKAMNGCDSTHSVSLAVLLTLQTTENQSVCSGDSVLIFGKYQRTAGTYAQKFKAKNGCDSTHSVSLAVLPTPQTTENQSVCSGDSVLIFGKYQHTAGIYTQKFKAMNGCDSTHSVSLAVLPTLQTTEKQSVCSGDSVLIFGKYQRTAGIYTQKFKAKGGCDSTHSISLAVLPTLQTTENQSVCSGDSVLIFGKYQHTAGIYTQKFKAKGGCDSTHSISLAVLPTLQTTEKQSICSGDSVLIFGKYQRTAGIYTQKFKTKNGCDSTHSISLAVLPTLQSAEKQSVCSGDSVLIFGKYQRTAGTYAQKFKAKNGCDSTHSISLAVLPILQTTENQSVCSGDSVLIFGKYQRTAGIYTQKFKAKGGCDSTHSVSLAVLPTLQTTENQSVCSGDSVLIFGKYQHTAGIYTQKFKAKGGCDSTHSVSLDLFENPLLAVEIQGSCPNDMTGTANILPKGGLAPYQISWNQTGIKGFNPKDLPSGTYQFTVSDQRSCRTIGQLNIPEWTLPTVMVTALPPACYNNSDGQIKISTASSGLQYSLNAAVFDTSTTFSGLKAGQYSLSIKDTVGCIQTQTLSLKNPAPISLELPGDTLIEKGQSIVIQAIVQGVGLSYTWSPPDGLDCVHCPTVTAKPLNTTVYTLALEDNNGCTMSSQIKIALKDVKNEGVFVPNAFYPNGQGPNRFFTLYGETKIREILRLELYDRWGNLVFARSHFAPGVPELGWNGIWRGQNATPGIYTYMAELMLEDGSVEKRGGDVLLVR